MKRIWKRPDSVPFPSIWGYHQGRTPLANGKIPKFRIQDLPPELEVEAIQHMIVHFLRDEPHTSFFGVHNDPEAIEDIKSLWVDGVKKRCTIVALIDNLEDFEDLNIPKIAGVNMTLPLSKGEEEEPINCKSKKMKDILSLMEDASHTVDVFDKYDVEVQLYAYGLSVHPMFRKQGLGEAIVNARYPMGKALRIPVTSVVFTGKASQKIGKKCRMEELSTVNPSEYKIDGVNIFKGVKTECIILMAARLY